MSDLIPIKFQLVSVVIFFVCMMAVFHLAFVYRTRTRRFWIKSDYTYYFIGVLGLLGITDNFQDLMYRHSLSQKQHAYEAGHQALRRRVDTLASALSSIDYRQWAEQGNYLYTSPAGTNTAGELPSGSIPHFRTASVWFSELSTSLASTQRTERWRELLMQAENTGDSGIAALDTDVNGTVQDLKKLLILESSINDLKKSVAMDSESEHELVELFIAPYLIALALALRMSKTSAEFLGRVKASEEEVS